MIIEIWRFNGIDHSIYKCGSSDLAKRQAKIDFQKMCIFSNTYPLPLAGAHVFSAGSYRELSRYPINIIPTAYRFHTGHKGSLDMKSDPYAQDENMLIETTPDERREYILEHCDPHHLKKVRNRLDLLWLLAEEKGALR